MQSLTTSTSRQRAEEVVALHRQRPVDHTRRRADELAALLKPYGESEATQKILTSSPEPSGSAMRIWALGMQTRLGSLAPHLSAGRRSAA